MLIKMSCNQPRLNFDRGFVPLIPENFADVNSAYDDYNSDLIMYWSSSVFTLTFSSNRMSQGNHFDIISFDCITESKLTNGEFSIMAGEVQTNLVDAVNSPANELGPYFTFDAAYYNFLYGFDHEILDDPERRFFFTSDETGNLDIYYTYFSTDGGILPEGNVAPLSSVNTDADEGYFTLHKGVNDDRENVYFTSNRDGDFDIFRATGEPAKLIDQSIDVEVLKIDILSSDADDKCPYIKNSMMVFTSDRGGGFGGFDLYYSTFVGSKWSEPVNFGARINTEYDEYRPIIVETDSSAFFNDFMIFSSNRPGGMGGYDLYYAGLKPGGY